MKESLSSENVLIERVPIGREVESPPQMRRDRDTLIIPVVEEVLVVERRLVLKEEIHVHKVRRVNRVEEPVSVKKTRAIVERDMRRKRSKTREITQRPRRSS